MASVASTTADFSIMILLVEILQCPVIPAGAVGTITGAVVNFIMGRNWVFDQSGKKIFMQVRKYALVWIGYLILTTMGMIFMEHFTSLHYMISKTAVSVLISFSYNYYMQKKLVFNG